MFEALRNYVTYFFNSFTIISLLDVAITSFLIYIIIGWIKNTQAYQVAKGIFVILLITLLSDLIGLVTLNYALTSVMTVGLLAVVIIFQPELRRALENLGSVNFILNLQKNEKNDDAENVIENIIDAVRDMSATKTGALIVIERESNLGDIIDTGVKLESKVSKNLLVNIFYPNTPLHDGAVIISKNRLLIEAAACLLPLTQSRKLNKQIGTRHRSALGISENSDCLAIVVSEENGTISYAINGTLSRFADLLTIENLLKETLITEDKKNKQKVGKK